MYGGRFLAQGRLRESAKLSKCDIRQGKGLSKHVLIVAGGTGGHVMPALAVAHCLMEQQYKVSWLGTKKGLEATLIPKLGFPLYTIQVKGLRRTKWLNWMLAPFMLIKALWQSFKIVHRVKPQVLLCMGGYVCGPAALAAWLKGIPIVLHEQNAVAGTTNRILALFSKKIIIAFPKVFERFATKVIQAGNPVRQEIINIRNQPPILKESTENQTIRILILGGSMGAQALNEVVPLALALCRGSKNIEVWHQTGTKHLAATRQLYQKKQLPVKISDFIDDMAQAYQWADILICRSGALTIAEIAAVGVASILIPFPYAVDDHQTQNARYLSCRGAAVLLPQNALTAFSLANALSDLIVCDQKRKSMAKAAFACACPNATIDVVKQLEVFCATKNATN